MCPPSTDRVDDVATSVSIAVVNAVATQRGVEPTALPPLYDWIEPDALDRLFADARDDAELRLAFTYDGHEISVERTDGLRILVDGSNVPELSCP